MFQKKKFLLSIVYPLWFVQNDDLHCDLRMNTVSEEIKKHATMHKNRLLKHGNPEMLSLIKNTEDMRRLKQTRQFDINGQKLCV